MNVSLVTYTYNDAQLLRELLDSIRTWNAEIHEIIVVDDASSPPADLSGFPGLTVLRNETNLGPARTKQRGLDHARGELIVSIDCDIRLHKDFLRHAMRYLAHPEVGAVGAWAARYSGPETLASRWANLRQLKNNTSRDEATDFICGQVFVLRPDVYRQVREVFTRDSNIAEDVRMSMAITGLGMRLMAVNKYKTWQARSLSLAQTCKQHLVYRGHSHINMALIHGPRAYADAQAEHLLADAALLRPEDRYLAVTPMLTTLFMLLFVHDKLAQSGLDADPAPLAALLGRFMDALRGRDKILGMAGAVASALDLPLPRGEAEGPTRTQQPRHDAFARELDRLCAVFEASGQVDPSAVTSRSGHYLDDKALEYGDYIGFGALQGGSGPPK